MQIKYLKALRISLVKNSSIFKFMKYPLNKKGQKFFLKFGYDFSFYRTAVLKFVLL